MHRHRFHLSGQTTAFLLISLGLALALLPLLRGVASGDFLKKDTAFNLKVGPFRSTATYAPSSGTTITWAMAKIGGAWGAATTATATTDANGWATLVGSTSDTDTAGSLLVRGTGTGVMQCYARNTVVVANCFNGMFTSTALAVNTTLIEGADPTDTIRDAVVDDATRIDASALNTLSGHDPGATIGTGTSILTQAQVTGGAYALDTDANGRIRIVDGTGAGEIDTASGAVTHVVLADTITTYTGNTLQTGDSYAIVNSGTHGNAALRTLLLDVPTVAEFEARSLVAADYFVVGDYTAPLDAAGIRGALGFAAADFDTQIGTLSTHSAADVVTALGTGATLTAIPWNAAWDAEVQSECNDAVTAFWTSPATLVTLVWNELLAGHNTAGSAGKVLNDGATIIIGP